MDKKNINDINSGTDNSEEPVLKNKNENTELSNEPVALEEFSQSPTAARRWCVMCTQRAMRGW